MQHNVCTAKKLKKVGTKKDKEAEVILIGGENYTQKKIRIEYNHVFSRRTKRSVVGQGESEEVKESRR